MRNIDSKFKTIYHKSATDYIHNNWTFLNVCFRFCFLHSVMQLHTDRGMRCSPAVHLVHPMNRSIWYRNPYMHRIPMLMHIYLLYTTLLIYTGHYFKNGLFGIWTRELWNANVHQGDRHNNKANCSKPCCTECDSKIATKMIPKWLLLLWMLTRKKKLAKLISRFEELCPWMGMGEKRNCRTHYHLLERIINFPSSTWPRR